MPISSTKIVRWILPARAITVATVFSFVALAAASHAQILGQPACVSPETFFPALPIASLPEAKTSAVQPLIVIGFMGGRISGSNIVHREAVLVRDLQQRYRGTVHAEMFANRDGSLALQSILRMLNVKRSGCLSPEEKRAARIVIFGHSWGASETVHLATQLNELGIPVLLTIQVDTVQKINEHDVAIPPNVLEAVNFYQTEGMLSGRRIIVATDPHRTTILGNYESSYKDKPVGITEYPWFARTFMKQHIEIENDPIVWAKIESLIIAKSCTQQAPETVAACLAGKQTAAKLSEEKLR